jgi:predicted nucleic acid-binding protein
VSVFVDTSALYAALDADDRHHTSARAAFAELSTDDLLLTHNYVVVETVALVQRRLGPEAVRAFLVDLLPAIDLLWISQGIHHEACARLLAEGGRRLSLVDCVSFTVMRQLGVEVAFAYDRHFGDGGFRTVPT